MSFVKLCTFWLSTGTGDAFEDFGVQLVRRQHVRIQHIKNSMNHGRRDTHPIGAQENPATPAWAQRCAMPPPRLSTRPERQRLLRGLLTDGKPTTLMCTKDVTAWKTPPRHSGARAAGLIPFCVTIDHEAHQYLPLLFGQGYALVHRLRIWSNTSRRPGPLTR